MNAATVISTAASGTDEWHQVRHTGIGGSDAAAICGLNPYRTPYLVWLDKSSPVDLTDTAGEAATWGTLLEPIVRAETERRENLAIVDAPGTYASAARPWQHANVDGLIGSTGVYEGKTASVYLAAEWANGKIPDRYLIQGWHYLAVLGPAYDHLVFSCLIGGQTLVTTRVERDQDAIEALTEIETEFWRRDEDGDPPDIDGTDATTELLGRLYEPVPGKTVTVDRATVAELIGRRARAQCIADGAKEDRRAAENALKAMLGEATEAHDETGKRMYTWRPQARRSWDTTRLTVDHPELAEQYQRISTSRVLRITSTEEHTP